MLEKNAEDFRSVIVSVISRVKVEKDPAAGLKMAFQVGEKKIPLGLAPSPGIFPAAMKGRGERRYQIELPSEIRQRLKPRNLVNGAVDPQEIDQAIEKRNVVHVETKAIVTESLRDIEEEAAAAANIQNPLWWEAV